MMLEWFAINSNPDFMEDYIEWLREGDLKKKEVKKEVKEEKKESDVQPGAGMRF